MAPPIDSCSVRPRGTDTWPITDNFLFKLEWAKPVIRPIDGQPPSDGLDNYVYFLAVKWF